MQEQIATEISEKLRLRLTSEQKKRLTKQHTHDTEAYQLYLKGRFYSSRRTEESIQRSFEYFQQAIERDPSYSLPYADMAVAYLFAQFYTMMAPSVGLPRARAAVAKALELDPSNAEARATLAMILSAFEWNNGAAEKEFLRAIELNPNSSVTLYFYATHLIQLGRPTEAEAAARRALKIDPLSAYHNNFLAVSLVCEKKYEAAAEQLRKSLEIDPSFANAHAWLSSALFHAGRHAEAITQIQKGLDLSGGDVWMRCLLAMFEGLTGRKERAMAQLQEILSLAEHRYVSPVHLSQVYFGLGDFDKVFDLLEKAFQDRDPVLRSVFVLPAFQDAAHHDPRFQDLVRRIHSFAGASLSGAA